MSSAAGVAGYFGELVRLQEEEAFTLGGQWHITRGTFAVWCPISRTDLRVVLSIPGSIETYAIGLDGQRIEASEALWEEVACFHCQQQIIPAFHSVVAGSRGWLIKGVVCCTICLVEANPSTTGSVGGF